MLTSDELLTLFRAIETANPGDSPFPIIGAIETARMGRTTIYRVPVLMSDATGDHTETLIITTRPVEAPNEFPGTLLGQPIVTGSSAHGSGIVAVQEGQEAATITPAVQGADEADAVTPTVPDANGDDAHGDDANGDNAPSATSTIQENHDAPAVAPAVEEDTAPSATSAKAA